MIHSLTGGDLSKYEVVRDFPVELVYEWVELGLTREDVAEKMRPRR